jgi:hypothetical protein
MKTKQRTPAIKDAFDDPEFQAIKAARDNVSPVDAVRCSVHITRQMTMMWRGKLVATPVELFDVLKALATKKVPFVLTGTYAIGTWTGRPRATKDVDILARPGRNHARAVKAIQERFPDLEVRKVQNVTAFFRPGERESVIDVALPSRGDNRAALEDTVWVDDPVNGVRYRIPARECAIANKYGAMLTLTRDLTKRLQDMVDLNLMAKHSMDEGQTPLDLVRIEELGEMVWPRGGGKELLRIVQMAMSDEVFSLNDLMGEIEPDGGKP